MITKRKVYAIPDRKAEKRLTKCHRDIKDLLHAIRGKVDLAIDDEKITQQDTRTLQNWVHSLTENVSEVSCIERSIQE